MPKTLSIDIRERILKAYDQGKSTRQEVADRFDVSLGMVKKLLHQRKHLGHINPQDYKSGNKPKITAQHKEQLIELLDSEPDLTLEDLKNRLNLDCSIQAIHYVLVGLGISYKKRLSEPLSKIARTSKKND